MASRRAAAPLVLGSRRRWAGRAERWTAGAAFNPAAAASSQLLWRWRRRLRASWRLRLIQVRDLCIFALSLGVCFRTSCTRGGVWVGRLGWGGGWMEGGGVSTPAHSTRQPQRGFFPQAAEGNNCLEKLLDDFFFLQISFLLSECPLWKFCFKIHGSALRFCSAFKLFQPRSVLNDTDG